MVQIIGIGQRISQCIGWNSGMKIVLHEADRLNLILREVFDEFENKYS